MSFARIVCGIVLGVAAVLAVGAPAHASLATPEPAVSALVLTVARGENLEPVSKVGMLLCDPIPRGVHPDAAAACRDLATAGADLAKLPGLGDRACTLEYDPVTVTVLGTWRGRLVAATRTYPNPCVLRVETGPVFSF